MVIPDHDIAQLLEQVHHRVLGLLRQLGRSPEDPSPTDPSRYIPGAIGRLPRGAIAAVAFRPPLNDKLVSAAIRPQREGYELHLPGISCPGRREHDVQEGGGRPLEEGLAYDDAGKAGHVVVAHALQPVERATTIWVRNGKLPGFLLIEARDLKETIQVAAKIG